MEILFQGVGESALMGGVFGAPMSYYGYKSSQHFLQKRNIIQGKLQSVKTEILSKENPSDEEIKILEAVETVSDAFDMNLTQLATDAVVANEAIKKTVNLENYGNEDYIQHQADESQKELQQLAALKHNSEATKNIVLEIAKQYPKFKFTIITDYPQIDTTTQKIIQDQNYELENINAFIKGNQIFINANEVAPSQVSKIIGHEIIGHIGIKAFLGEKNYNTLLTQLAQANPEKIQELAQTYKTSDQLYLAEEYLANLSDSNVKDANILQVVYQKIKSALRTVPLLKNVRYTDSEINRIIRLTQRNLHKEKINPNQVESKTEISEKNLKYSTKQKQDNLISAEKFIVENLNKNTRNKTFKIILPIEVEQKVENIIGEKSLDHTITINSVIHSIKNHGENGIKNNKKSIPITNEIASLIPNIMVSPDKIIPGSVDRNGNKSIRFTKEISNGQIIVVEKQKINNPQGMETITMWAELSNVTDAHLKKKSPSSHVQNVIISKSDIINIKKNAQNATENSENNTNFSLTAPNNNIKFSIKKSEQNNWEKIVTVFENGTLDKRKIHIALQRTPDILQACKVDNLPMAITYGTLEKITKTKHQIPLSELNKLLSEIDNPIAVLQSRTVPDSIVLFTDIIDNEKNNKSLVAIHLNKIKERFLINEITSIHGRNVNNFYDMIQDNQALYVNQKKSRDYLRRVGLQLPAMASKNGNKLLLTEEDFTSNNIGKIVEDLGNTSQNSENNTNFSLTAPEEKHLNILEKITPKLHVKTSKETKGILLQIKGKELHNNHDNTNARITGNGIRKLTSNAAMDKSRNNGFTNEEHLTIAANLEQLFPDAFLSKVESDRIEDVNINTIKRYSSLVFINDKFVEALWTVKDTTQHGNNIYSVELMDLELKEKTARDDALKHNEEVIKDNLHPLTDGTDNINNLYEQAIDALKNKYKFSLAPEEKHLNILEKITPKLHVKTRGETESILKKIKGKELHNNHDNINAKITTTGIGKITSNAAMEKSNNNGFTNEEHLTIAANLEQLFPDAFLSKVESDRIEDVNINTIKRYSSLVFINDKFMEALWTVKDTTQHGNNIYSVELMDLELKEKPPETAHTKGAAKKLENQLNPLTDGTDNINSLYEQAIDALKNKYKFSLAPESKYTLLVEALYKLNQAQEIDLQNATVEEIQNHLAGKYALPREIYPAELVEKAMQKAKNYRLSQKEEIFGEILYASKSAEKSAQEYQRILNKIDKEKNAKEKYEEKTNIISKKIENGEIIKDKEIHDYVESAQLPSDKLQSKLQYEIARLFEFSNKATKKYPLGERRHRFEDIKKNIERETIAYLREQSIENINKYIEEWKAKASVYNIITSSDFLLANMVEKIRIFSTMDKQAVNRRNAFIMSQSSQADNDVIRTQFEEDTFLLNLFGDLKNADIDKALDAENFLKEITTDVKGKLKSLILERLERDKKERLEINKQLGNPTISNTGDNAKKSIFDNDFLVKNKTLKTILLSAHNGTIEEFDGTILSDIYNEIHDKSIKYQNNIIKVNKAFKEKFTNIFKTSWHDKSAKVNELQKVHENSGVFINEFYSFSETDQEIGGRKHSTKSLEITAELRKDIENYRDKKHTFSSMDESMEFLSKQLADFDAGITKEETYFHDTNLDSQIALIIKDNFNQNCLTKIIPSKKEFVRRKELQLSQLSALSLFLTLRQKDYQANAGWNGFTVETMQQIEEFITPEVMELGEWMVEYLKKGKNQLEENIKKHYNNSLPINELYFPGKFDVPAKDMTKEKTADINMKLNPSFMIARSFHTCQLKTDDNAIKTFFDAITEQSQFNNFYDLSIRLKSLFLDDSVAKTFKKILGVNHYKEMIDRMNTIINVGSAEIETQNWSRRINDLFIPAKIFANTSSALKQIFGGLAYATDIPITDYLRGITEVAGNISHIATTTEFQKWWNEVKNSQYFENRKDGAFDKDIINLSNSKFGSKPTNIVKDVSSSIIQAGMLGMKYGDMFAIISGYTVYKYHLKQGLTKNLKETPEVYAMRKWQMATDETQQSGYHKDLNKWQSDHGLGRFFTAFMSNPILHMNRIMQIANEAKKQKKLTKNLAKALTLHFSVMAVSMWIISSLMKYGFDEDQWEYEDLISDMIIGPFQSMYLSGRMSKAFLESALGGGYYSATNNISKAFPILDDLYRSKNFVGKKIKDYQDGEEFSFEDALRSIENLGTLFILLPPVGELGTILNGMGIQTNRVRKLLSEKE